MNEEKLLALVDGKTEEEIREILRRNYNIFWQPNGLACKSWYAQVFNYCNAEEFEEQLRFFLWLVNFFAPIFHVCFQEEETVYLGCVCGCGYKQTILYYSITRQS